MIRHLDALRALDLPEGGYAVFGSAPLAVRGLRANEDLDVLVTKDVWRGLCASHPVSRRSDRPDMIHIGPVQVLEVDYADWSPAITDNSVLIEEAETFEGLPFVRLEHLLQCKKMMGGEKHDRDVEIILRHLDGPRDSTREEQRVE